MTPGRLVPLAACLLACLMLAGCSGEHTRAEVRGKVTWKGAAPNLTGLHISFLGADNKPVTALVDQSGTYTANVMTGDNLVVVSWQPPDDQNPFRTGKAKGKGPQPPAGERPADPSDQIKSPIPLRYASPATSRLKCVVAPDKTNTFNVDLVE
jgi:hypothetical protein